MRKFVVGAVVLILVVAAVALASRRVTPVPQPIAFPHKTHIANQMECLSCHQNADRSTMSDPESEVSRLAESRRGHRLLEELGTRPRVVYLKEGSA